MNELVESGYQLVHVRWPAHVLLDYDCDDPHRVAREIAQAVAGYVQDRRTQADYEALELALFEWILEQRGLAAVSAHA